VVPRAGFFDFVLWALGLRQRFRVSGESMRPELAPGDDVFVQLGVYACRLPVPGEVVLVRHPFKKSVRMVKRVVAVRDGRVELCGDNPSESTDSRQFGAVSTELLVGHVTSAWRGRDSHGTS
jgi:nickel-type superoxide dismutase maturation protease